MINKKIILPPDASAFNATTSYTNNSDNSLLQHYIVLEGSDTMGFFFRRHSYDNGMTWSEPSCQFKLFKNDKGTVRRGENTLFFDRDKSALINVYNLHIYPASSFSGEMYKYTRIFFEISFDGGKSFSEPQQLIHEGYDEVNWSKDICFGRNQAMISFSEIIKKDGKLILPAQMTPHDSDFSKPYKIKQRAGCFIGEWENDTIKWHCGDWLYLEEEFSTRGIFEPVIAELKDKKLIMICRASNAGRPEISSFKWCSFSDDGGFTWSKAIPLRYNDGKKAFSPSSGSKLIRSSSNNKLYWIGNLTDENPDGNRPRYPLLILEFDDDKKSLVKESIRVIDTKQESDYPLVQLSNFKIYEDRETHEFVLNMARLQEHGSNMSGNTVYEYRITPG